MQNKVIYELQDVCTFDFCHFLPAGDVINSCDVIKIKVFRFFEKKLKVDDMKAIFSKTVDNFVKRLETNLKFDLSSKSTYLNFFDKGLSFLENCR